MRTRTTMAVGAALIGSTAARAADWQVASVAESAVSFVDAETVMRQGSTVTFWRDVRFKHIENGINRILSRYSANCEDNSYEHIQSSYMLDQKLINQAGYAPRSYAAPDTTMEATINSVCRDEYFAPAKPDRETVLKSLF